VPKASTPLEMKNSNKCGANSSNLNISHFSLLEIRLMTGDEGEAQHERHEKGGA